MRPIHQMCTLPNTKTKNIRFFNLMSAYAVLQQCNQMSAELTNILWQKLGI